MNKRTKHLALLILAQTGCVAVGLWMQQNYIASAVYHEAEDITWTDMETQLDRIIAKFGLLGTHDPYSNADVFKEAEAIFQEKFPDMGRLLLVDQKWQVINPDNHEQTESEVSPPDCISFRPATKDSFALSSHVRGRFTDSTGTHLALACKLKNNLGYALLNVPLKKIAINPATMIHFLPIIGIVTLVWISALSGIIVYILLARLYDSSKEDRSRHTTDAFKQAQTLLRTRDAVIFGMAKLADSRDPETGDHLERITAYATALASGLRRHPKFRDQITPTFIKLIGISSALHDIGKVGIEDKILTKKGPLTDAERLRMQNHTIIGGKCLEEIEKRLGGSNFLQMAREIALAHHERWDGSGYPHNLKTEQIPLCARIVAVADVYDAVTSARVYKKAVSHPECAELIQKESGKHFDPDIVMVWLEIQQKFQNIALHYENSDRDETSILLPETENSMETQDNPENQTALSEPVYP